MGAFNDRFENLSDEQRQARYQALAGAALAEYALGAVKVNFIGHNAGIAYRIAARSTGQAFLLKIAEPVGTGESSKPVRVHSVLLWLAALAHDTELVVQEPIPNQQGELMTAVPFADLPVPFYCSLQRWVSGTHVTNNFTVTQMYHLGAAIATLHRHGSGWMPALMLPATDLDPRWVSEREHSLYRVVELGILRPSEWGLVETACKHMRAVMDTLGAEPQVWGPIHGDLHHQNVLFVDDQARLIDFGELVRAHFLYDLGVTLYHTMYHEDVLARQALIEGYRSVRPLGELSNLEPETFLCAAALGNLAFQITIPRERASDIFARNMREFATVFCRKLVAGEPFACSA